MIEKGSDGALWKFAGLGCVDQKRFKESSVARAVPHAARTLDGKAPRRSSDRRGAKMSTSIPKTNSVIFRVRTLPKPPPYSPCQAVASRAE